MSFGLVERDFKVWAMFVLYFTKYPLEKKPLTLHLNTLELFVPKDASSSPALQTRKYMFLGCL